MYVLDYLEDSVFEYRTKASAFPTSANHTAITNASGQINTEFWTDINNMTADDAANDGSIYYAVSTDDQQTFSIVKSGEGVRNIARNNGGTWEINDASDYGSETWVAAAENDKFYALEEAVDIDTAQVVNGFDLENASYEGEQFDLSGQDTFGRSFTFNSTGEKIYYIGGGNATVFEYTLSVAFDPSTASYSGNSFNVSSQINSPRQMSIGSSDTKLFIADSTTDSVYQYSFATAGDVASLSYDSVSFDLSSQDGNPYSLTFNNDGSKMYMAGLSSGSIYQYSLSTAFDLSSVVFDNVSFSISSEGPAPQSILFNEQGSKLFVVDDSTRSIFEYNLATAFDLSTISYSGISFDPTTEENSPKSIDFSDDGAKMFLIGNQNEKIHQYSTGSISSANRMDASQLGSASDAEYFTLGDTFDLAVTLTMPDSGSTSPTSDGVSINYDATAKNQGAILGTDYEWDRPAADTVNFKALSNENFKVRVV